MIAEALLYATAKSEPALRRRGLVGDAVAIWSRATRQRRAWADHEARCRAFVLECVEGTKARRTAVILGSGLLRDVPAPELARAFDRVVLVDAVHLWPTRRRARRHGCEIVVADLVGDSDRGSLAELLRDASVDLVISANVLSQLPMSLTRHQREADPARKAARDILRRHIGDLASVRGRVCLLSDVAYRDVDPEGRVIEETDLMHGLALPPPDVAWDWTVGPRGEIDRGFARIHRVQAWRDFRPASL